LEEQLSHAKKDEGCHKEFKACVEKVRVEIEDISMDMYAHLHVFQ
jgi:hypothetical protein